MHKKAIIITGSSGEIGKNLINYFINNSSDKIIALDLNQSNKEDRNVTFIKGDILDNNLLKKISDEYYIHEIYHLAAILSSKAAKNPKLSTSVNVDGTINMFNIALKQNLEFGDLVKFFFPSSIAVYGESQKTKLKNLEFMNCNPITVYGQNKLYCENIGVALNDYGNELNQKIDFRCIRFPGIISANTLPTGGTSDYIPEMIHRGLSKVHYDCFVSEDSILPFITMPDAIDAIIKIMITEKRKLTKCVYNITSFSPEINEICNRIMKLNKNFILTFSIDKMKQKIVDSWPQYIDDSLAKKDWDWQPNHNLDKAFSDYLIPNLWKE